MFYRDTNQLILQNVTEFILSIANTSANSGSNRLLFGHYKRLMECDVRTRHKSINCVPNRQLKHYFQKKKKCVKHFEQKKGKPEETLEIFFNKLPVFNFTWQNPYLH